MPIVPWILLISFHVMSFWKKQEVQQLKYMRIFLRVENNKTKDKSRWDWEGKSAKKKKWKNSTEDMWVENVPWGQWVIFILFQR